MRYLKTFFAEKQLPFQQWELMATDGCAHVISNEVVIETILNSCSTKEQKKIANVIRRIDYANGDVNDFLKHLAGGLINRSSL